MHVLCGQCGRTEEVADALAGGTVSCPHCGGRIAVPDFAAPAAAPPKVKEGPMVADPGTPPATDGGFAEAAKQVGARKVPVTCEKCGNKMAISARFSGKRAKCPKCGTMNQIPYPDESDVKLRQIDEPALQEIDLGEEPPEAPAAPAMPWRGAKYVKTIAIIVAASIVLGLAIPLTVGMLSGKPKPPPPKKPAATPQVAAVPANIPRPAAAKLPTMADVSGKLDLFAADGYLPAPPGKVYAKVQATVTAGDERLVLPTYGDNVKLTSDSGEYASLGQSPEDMILPAKGQTTTLSIEAGKAQTLTVVFEVPAGLKSGTLRISSVGQAKVSVDPLPDDPPAKSIEGNYIERPPRNLRPLSSNQLLAAIQGVPNLALQIRAQGQKDPEFNVSMTNLGFGGMAKSVGGGLYQMPLRYGRADMKCVLRLVDGGKMLVLYFSEEPWNQMTFLKQQ